MEYGLLRVLSAMTISLTDISYTCCWRTRSFWFPPVSISRTCCDVIRTNYGTTRDGVNLTLICIIIRGGGGGGGTMRINRWVCFHHTIIDTVSIENFDINVKRDNTIFYWYYITIINTKSKYI